MEMSKTYNPQSFESKWYKIWEEKGYFRAEIDKNKKPYTIVIPPPNITGQLHMGHALDNSIQDILIRYKRMQGYSTLWLPGTDHASIATEVKVVEKLASEGISKKDIGREEFLKHAWAWKDQYGGRIVEQLKRLGSSCDWSREAFTMDDKCSKAVKHVFVKLFNKGLIYRGSRIINWCPSCQTALSDAEVDHIEQASHFWHFKYPLTDGSGYIIVATTRPETIPGDTAVAVNPKDERYASFIGKTIMLPLVNREIPIIADDYVSIEFGTGAVKITPAHDPNDFEVGERHDLPIIRVMNNDGTMNELSGGYNGQERLIARKNIVADFDKLGLLYKIEDHSHNVGTCYRCKSDIEPIVSKQWFVDMKPLAQPAIDVVRNDEVSFVPNSFSNIYFNWMENIKDWCISRQLWWGHRIPAYYCNECEEMMVGEVEPTKCNKCGSTSIRQDEDVLDTWFSSALWPFSTLGYPDKTPDLDYFYPTDVLVTGYDIIFFWVARMVFSGLEHMGEAPFSKVLIHGLVRDGQGRKMSKSLNNGIDPLEIIDEYGADTLRFALITGISSGGDTRFSYDKVENCRNFMNKIWNASRFVLLNINDVDLPELGTFEFAPADKWILTRLNSVIKDVTRNIDKFEVGISGSKLYDFIWNELCDWYIELIKPSLYSGNDESKANSLAVMIYVLKSTVKLLHPFAPFITEEIFSMLPNTNESIMISSFPEYDEKYDFQAEYEQFRGIMEIIKNIRGVRAEMNVIPSKRINIQLVLHTDESIIIDGKVYIEKLANVMNIEIVKDKETIDSKAVIAVGEIADVYISMGDLVDINKEIEKLQKEYEDNEKEIKRSNGMLNNKGFMNKAPAEVVEGEKSKLENYLAIRKKLGERIELLK